MAKSNAKIRVLILSETIFSNVGRSEMPYEPPYDVDLDMGYINREEGFNFSIFDYDVSIIHIEKPGRHTIGYHHNLPKIFRDSEIALEHGRTIICLPETMNFRSESRSQLGMFAYDWLTTLGVELHDNFGENIKPSGAGQASAIVEYLQSVVHYYQIIKKPIPSPASTLAVVEGTSIVVGAQHDRGQGKLVILPPPVLNKNTYNLVMLRLLEIARRYHERAQKKVFVGDVPSWLQPMLPLSVQELNKQIEELRAEKSIYDEIAYVTYGTGDELENAVALLLRDLGLFVELQPKGANIDLKAKHSESGQGFAIEVTGTKGTIQKNSDKVSQAWQYINETSGTPDEKDRLVIVANTQYHLDPNQRQSESFSAPAAKLLTKNGVLLITTLQLYALWKEVYEKRANAVDVIRRLHESSGLWI